MEFYLVRNEKLYSGCIGEVVWAMVGINHKAGNQQLMVGGQLEKFQKVWTRLVGCCNLEKKAVIMQIEFGLPSVPHGDDCVHHTEGSPPGSTCEQPVLQVGVCASRITDSLVKLFGEGNVRLRVQITNLFQGEIKLNDILSPELSLMDKPSERFACASWGTFSFVDEIDFYEIPLPTGDISVRVIVTKAGLDKLESGSLDIKQ